MKSRSAAPRRFSASDTLISVFPRKTELESEEGQASNPLPCGRSARQVQVGTAALKRWTGLLGPSRQGMRPSVSRTNKIGEFQKKEFDKSPPEVKDVDFQSLEIDQRHKNQWRNTVWKTATGP